MALEIAKHKANMNTSSFDSNIFPEDLQENTFS